VVAARFDGDGLPLPDDKSEVGHLVYPLNEGESTTEPVPVYTGSPAPVPIGQTRRMWILVAALLALAAVLYLVTQT